jgi:hypothetical protein
MSKHSGIEELDDGFEFEDEGADEDLLSEADGPYAVAKSVQKSSASGSSVSSTLATVLAPIYSIKSWWSSSIFPKVTSGFSFVGTWSWNLVTGALVLVIPLHRALLFEELTKEVGSAGASAVEGAAGAAASAIPRL